MKSAVKQAIESIKQAGFTHIKVELEGNIGRDGNRNCDDCYGEGRVDCNVCEGEGYREVEDDITGLITRTDCDDCYGDGRYDCEYCDGGTNNHYASEDDCNDFMWNHVSQATRDATTYGNFYEDGSVDSEFTVTVPLDKPEAILEWIDAFKAVALEFGDRDGDIDVEGAGMHVSVLTSGHYCHHRGCTDCGRLNTAGVRNFQRQVSKLLPALFFAGSAGHQSRSLNFRRPQISTDDKYSAIYTVGNRCFEFRLFETCYDRPEAFYDYIQVIANCLKFYADPTLEVRALGKDFLFTEGHAVARFFSTTESLRVLNATIKHVKPRDKSFKRLKHERGVMGTVKSLSLDEKVKVARLRSDYHEYRKNYLEVSSRPLSEREQRDVDYLMIQGGYSRDGAVEHIRGMGTLQTMAEFIRRELVNNSYGTTISV